MTSKFRSITQTRRWALMVAAVGLTTFATLALAHEGATGVVKERMDLMGDQKKDMKLLNDMAKGKTPFDAVKATAAARDLEITAKKIPDLFPEGSTSHPSEALPAVWEEWDRFKGSAKDLEDSANALATALDAPGQHDWKPALQKVTDACKSCHEDFRSKEKEGGHH
jgi:cytochrome c556